MFIPRIAIAAFLALATCLPGATAVARELIDEPVILVATPELRGQPYSASVLIVTPIGAGQHIGFIINRPTPVKLSEMFPGHEPSKKVTEPVFLGGPENVGALFALVQRQDSASARQLKMAPDLYLEIEREKVDGVIENEYRQARFFSGVVVWEPGELEAEIEHDFWYVQDPDVELVLRKSTAGMWEELVKRSERNKNALTAAAQLQHVPQAITQ